VIGTQGAANSRGIRFGMRLAPERAEPGKDSRGGVCLVRLLRFVLASFALSAALSAAALPAAALPVTLALVPSSTSVAFGQTLSVDVVVGGLSELDGDVEQEMALESFDLDLAFDTSRLAFTSLSFGAALGDPGDGGETFVSGPGSPNGTGVVLLFEFSFLTEAQLLALQAAPFTLATLQFQALAVAGDAALALVNLDGSSLGGVAGRALGDELAAPSALTIEVVPEPRGAALALAAAAGLVLRRRAARG
jgi:hypothetical protein